MCIRDSCISDYREEANNEEADLVIPPADEAIIILMLKNCAIKWPYTWECMDNDVEPNKEADEMKTPYAKPLATVNGVDGMKQAGCVLASSGP